MFDNTFVYLQAITDSIKEPVMDNLGNPIESRTYSGLLAKFMEGIPPEFQVSGYLRDNARRGIYLLSNAQREYTLYDLELVEIKTMFDGILLSSDYSCRQASTQFFSGN